MFVLDSKRVRDKSRRETGRAGAARVRRRCEARRPLRGRRRRSGRAAARFFSQTRSGQSTIHVPLSLGTYRPAVRKIDNGFPENDEGPRAAADPEFRSVKSKVIFRRPRVRHSIPAGFDSASPTLSEVQRLPDRPIRTSEPGYFRAGDRQPSRSFPLPPRRRTNPVPAGAPPTRNCPGSGVRIGHDGTYYALRSVTRLRQFPQLLIVTRRAVVIIFPTTFIVVERERKAATRTRRDSEQRAQSRSTSRRAERGSLVFGRRPMSSRQRVRERVCK